MFPNPSSAFSFTKLRQPRGLTKEFALKAKALGFEALRFHDLRGSHERRCSTRVCRCMSLPRAVADPAVLLRSYAKRTKKADTSAAAVQYRREPCASGVWVRVVSKR